MAKIIMWSEVGGRQQQLDNLISYSEAILASAEIGDWVAAEEIQQRRKQAIEAFFFQPPEAEESAAIASTIQTILAMDAKVTQLAREGRKLLMQEAATIAKTHKQAGCYLTSY